MEKLVMAYWDCPVCGNKGIRGNVTNCPSCGRARGDVQFYMKEDSAPEFLTEEEEKQVGGKSPDWYCSFCNSLNKDHAAFCSNCGASRESSESNYFDQLKKRQEQEAAEKAAQAQHQPQPQKKSRGRMFIALAVVLAVIIGLVTFMNGNTTKGNMEVTAIGWNRTIPVEQYQMFQESGWALPEGTEKTGESQQIHHYDQVLDHYENVEVERSRRVIDSYETYYTYEDNGNGSYTQVSHERPVYKTEYYTETESRPVYVSVPRYQTKYEYNIWRWVWVRDVNASGEDHEAVWPETGLAEDEREGSERKESYFFTVKDEKEARTSWQLAMADWQKISVGDHLNITSRRGGGEDWITDENGNQIARIYQK